MGTFLQDGLLPPTKVDDPAQSARLAALDPKFKASAEEWNKLLGAVGDLHTDARTREFNVRHYGAKCDGVTDDTVAINAALAAGAGKRVIIPASTVISSVLAIRSGTWLDVEPSATITFKAGSSGNMLVNQAAVTVQRTVTDAAITAGTTDLTSATANFTAADVGRSVVVSGAGPGGGSTQHPSPGVLCATIAAVGSATSATLSTPALATVAGAQAKFYDRDFNIRVSGGLWARGNASAANGFGLHTLNFRRVDDLTLERLSFTSTNGKYCICVGDVTRLDARRLHFAGVSSDGIHVLGPVNVVAIRDVSGTTGDDVVAFTALDYLAYADVAGDIQNVLVERVSATSTTPNILKLLGGTGTKLRNITARNLEGQGSNIVTLTDDGTGQTDAAGIRFEDLRSRGPTTSVVVVSAPLAKDVTIRGIVDASTTAGYAVRVLQNCETLSVEDVTLSAVTTAARGAIETAAGVTVGVLQLGGIRWNRGAGVSGAQPVVSVQGTVRHVRLRALDFVANNGAVNNQVVWLRGTHESVELSGLSFLHQTAASDSALGLILTNGSTIGHLKVSGVQASLQGTATPVIGLGGTAGRVIISDAHVLNGRSLFDLSGAVGPVLVNGANLKSTSRLSNISANADVTLEGFVADSLAAAAFHVSAGATLTIRGAGVARVTTWVGVSRAAAEVVRCLNGDFPVDVSILGKANGDMAWNTNAALACGAGRVLSDGTNWKNLFSGAVY